MTTAFRIHAGTYQDSVKLMRISAAGSERPGVEVAVAVMATEANLDNLRNAEFDPSEAGKTSPNDLILAVRAETKKAVEAALDAMEEMLSAPPAGVAGEVFRPRTLSSALHQQPEATFCLISVPGPFVRREAEEALASGLHCMIFSDNVSVEDEIYLKTLADGKGLLVMGPDCGTAIIGGKALAFANAVSRGPVGLIGASGTGIQAVSVLVDRLGSGISHAIGTGGRDLSEAVGGRSMLKGIGLLAQDEATKVLVLISKPPHPGVMRRVLIAASRTGKPVVAVLLGGDPKAVEEFGVRAAGDLEEAARIGVALARGEEPPAGEPEPSPQWEQWVEEERQRLGPGQRFVRGLYSGGTLCDEAMLLLQDAVGKIHSNVPLEEDLRLIDPHRSVRHTVVDLGEDFFTRGRPHPMIDPAIRNERILREAEDPEAAILLLDFVMGYGAHEDPAGAAAEAIRTATEKAEKTGRGLSVVASVCGTEKDPQSLSVQENALRQAGARVFPSNAQAARFAAALAKAIAS
ncbi:MAG: acyl-CoA synthetase FdrA [Nitrospinota bacterium]